MNTNSDIYSKLFWKWVDTVKSTTIASELYQIFQNNSKLVSLLPCFNSDRILSLAIADTQSHLVASYVSRHSINISRSHWYFHLDSSALTVLRMSKQNTGSMTHWKWWTHSKQSRAFCALLQCQERLLSLSFVSHRDKKDTSCFAGLQEDILNG